ncbi:MAG: SpoVA/SpoVAEb family sporulation membrane protein [Clostridia bacterium]|nr:SpoVA/SpoVAEb family sporulation membrane protein [Clostridia bacterium]
MTIFLNLLKAFVVGGAICVVGEALVLKTKLTPARILVGYIVAGVILSAVGLYGPLAEFAGAGASVPLTGFGHALTTGVKRAVQEIGFMGAFTGGLTNTAAGIAAAVFFGTLVAMLFKPKAKH